MMTPKTQTIVASTTIALTTIVSLSLIPMKPDASAIVLGMMAVFVIVWNGMKYLVRRKCKDSDWINSKVRHEILFAIILACLLLLGSISATLAKELEIFDRDLVKRIVGVNIGLMLVVLGNYMPKKLMQHNESCCTKSSKSVQRLMGWIFVLGGLLYALAWIALDLDQAGIAIMFAFPVAIAAVVLARIAYIRLSGAKKTAEQSV